MTDLDLRHLLKVPTFYDAVVQHPQRLIPLAQRVRIFSHGGKFRCGLCNKAYAEPHTAWVCVAACSVVEFENLGIDSRVAGERTLYGCPFCFKQYSNREDASDCFEKCRDELLALLPAEALRLAMLGVPSELPDGGVGKELERAPVLAEHSTKTRVEHLVPLELLTEVEQLNIMVPVPEGASFEDLTLVAEEPAAEEPAAEEPSAEEDSPTTEELPQSPPQSSFAASESTEDITIKRKSGQKPFTRDGARYICSACKTKYFTKSDVESCFESHPLEVEEGG